MSAEEIKKQRADKGASLEDLQNPRELSETFGLPVLLVVSLIRVNKIPPQRLGFRSGLYSVEKVRSAVESYKK